MVGPQDTFDRTLADPLLEELARSPDLTPFAALVEPRLARVEKLTGLGLKRPRARLALQLGLLFIGEKERSSEDEAQHP